MSALSYILLVYVLVTVGALIAIYLVDARDRRKHHHALEEAIAKFSQIIDILERVQRTGERRHVPQERRRDPLQRLESMRFPIRSYAEDESARQWLKKALEVMNVSRAQRRSLSGQPE